MMTEPPADLARRILLVLDMAKDPAAFSTVELAYDRAASCASKSQGFGAIVATLALAIGQAEADQQHQTAATLLDVLRLVALEHAIGRIVADGFDELSG